EVLPYLESLQRHLDIPVLYVSHAQDEVARLAQHVVLLDHGRAVFAGDTATAMAQSLHPMAPATDAAALVHATVTAYDAQDHLSSFSFDGGTLMISGAVPRPVGSTARLRVLARDVSVALQAPQHSSILNRIPATLTAMHEDSPGQVLLHLQAGQTTLLALVSARSVREMALQPGQPLIAQIKSVALLD
ncbi:MAG: TOBE domain-containing protein, partial [Comamonas sp.]